MRILHFSAILALSINTASAGTVAESFQLDGAEALGSTLAGSKDFAQTNSEVQSAISQFKNGKDDLGEETLFQAINNLGVAPGQLQSLAENEIRMAQTSNVPGINQAIEEAIDQRPAEVSALEARSIQSLEMLVQTIYKFEQEKRKESYIASHLSPRRTASVDRAYLKIGTALEMLKERLANDRSPYLRAYIKTKKNLYTHLTLCLDAIFNRYSTSEDRADELQSSIVDFIRSYHFSIDDDQLALFAEADKHEKTLRLIVNRKNASTVGLCAFLVSEAISIPFSFGLTSATMPATVTAIVGTLSVTSSGIFISTEALGMLDTYNQKGIKGLETVDTAFDVLFVLFSLPAPMKASLISKPFYMDYVKGEVYGTYALLAGRIVTEIWAFEHADQTAHDQTKAGQPTTAHQVKKSAVMSILLNLLMGTAQAQAWHGDQIDIQKIMNSSPALQGKRESKLRNRLVTQFRRNSRDDVNGQVFSFA